MAASLLVPPCTSAFSAEQVAGSDRRGSRLQTRPGEWVGLRRALPAVGRDRGWIRVLKPGRGGVGCARAFGEEGLTVGEGRGVASTGSRSSLGWRVVERDVSVQAGRSKAKRKGGGGRIEKRVEKKTTVVKKKVVVKEPDPGVRMPDEYYKYGPYGPYWWRADVIGKPVPGKLGDSLAVTMTTLNGGDEEVEEMARVDATINYTHKLKQMSQDVGLHYYWAFARSVRPSAVVLAPWEEWTLVAQVVVESATEPDKWRLGFRLDKAMRNVITQCVAWERPDLTYVRKPKYQLRTENQLEFLQVLCHLVNPDLETDAGKRCVSYFGKLCRLLDVDMNVKEEDAAAAYDKLSKEGRMKVVEHLLTNHPVSLLYPYTEGTRRAEWRAKQAADEQELERDEEVTEDEDEEEEGEASDFEDGEEDDGEEGEVADDDEDDDEELSPWEEYMRYGGKEGLKEGDFKLDGPGSDKWLDEVEVIEGGDDLDEDLDILDAKNLWKEGDTTSVAGANEDNAEGTSFSSSYRTSRTTRFAERDDDGEVSPELLLKAAVRPFTYRNLVKEVVALRRMLLEDPWRPS